MGNTQPNYFATYNAWLQYNKLRTSSTSQFRSSQAKSSQSITNLSPPSAVTVENKTNSHQNSNLPVSSVTPVIPINSEQIKKSIPSVIPESKIASVLNLSQQNQSKVSSVNQNNSLQISATEVAGQKATSISQKTILLSNRGSSKDKKIKFPSKIDLIDSFKSQVKATRQRIDSFASAQEKEYIWILSQIQNQKVNLIPDKNKLIYLLKQSRDYERLIIGLRTKRQSVVKVLNQLNEQLYSEDLKEIISEANQYADSIQQEFLRIDWKTIILEAGTNIQRYIDIINQGVADPMVQQAFAQIESQVQAIRPPPPAPPVSQTPTTVQIETAIIQPEPTNHLPSLSSIQQQKEEIFVDRKVKDASTSQSLVDHIENMIIGNSQNQNPISSNLSQFRNSQKASNIQSKLHSPQSHGYGLVVTTPSLIHTKPVYEPLTKTQIDAQNQHIGNQISSPQQIQTRLSQIRQSVQKLSEIKNLKGATQVKPETSTKSIKPIINGFQSSVKPPPSYNAFSIPQNLLK